MLYGSGRDYIFQCFIIPACKHMHTYTHMHTQERNEKTQERNEKTAQVQRKFSVRWNNFTQIYPPLQNCHDSFVHKQRLYQKNPQ